MKLFDKATHADLKKDLGQPDRSPIGRSKSTDSVKDKQAAAQNGEDQEEDL